MIIMVSAQNLISDAATHNYTAFFGYGDGSTGCNIGLPEALMATPPLPSDAYGFPLTYPNANGAAANDNGNQDNHNNNNNNRCVQVLGRSTDDRSIFSLSAGNSIIGCNYHRDWHHHNHNKSVIMAEGAGEHQVVVVVQDQDSLRTCNSINEGPSSSSNKPTRDEHQQQGGGEEEEEGSWLQLGIGTCRSGQHDHESTAEMASGASSPRTAGSTGLPKLDLNLGGGAGVYSSLQEAVIRMPLPGRHPPTPNPGAYAYAQNQNQQAWGFLRSNRYHHQYPMAARPASFNSSPSPSALPLMARPPPNFLLGPYHRHAHVDTNNTLITLIDPPPRTPLSGIWFMLLASHPQYASLSSFSLPISFLIIISLRFLIRYVLLFAFQIRRAKEPFLPQLPKRFLRIKYLSFSPSLFVFVFSVFHFLKSMISYRKIICFLRVSWSSALIF